MTQFLAPAAFIAALSAVATLPAAAQPGAMPITSAAPQAAFEARTVADLATLCGMSPQAAQYTSAVAFCHGFLQGAGQYHAAVSQPGSGNAPVFCAPNPPPTRAQVANAFVAWAEANPQHRGERAVDGLARWAHAAYPCPAPQRQGRSQAR
ncbi:hypothetical protein E0493_20540 [Roseomonas sp. M0104]|uniref:Rap1a immunity protein domain-containing protein n=1 Tax=Teichococcus coralli TaxID=2545983 RepID=A0A845BKQ7_9PROT|nr:Rap1a/Tai family immunity protein [Pseudoroseomonas coralli]MXP65742.1 hypothetical protein [Pseudoroseomonas coralli]